MKYKYSSSRSKAIKVTSTDLESLKYPVLDSVTGEFYSQDTVSSWENISVTCINKFNIIMALMVTRTLKGDIPETLAVVASLDHWLPGRTYWKGASTTSNV